jgi:hypothetical protein
MWVLTSTAVLLKLDTISLFEYLTKLLLLSVVLFHFICLVSSLDEDEQMEEYVACNYTWPPIMNPNTQGWSKLMMRRFCQLEFIEDLNGRYNGYLVAVRSECFYFL